VTSGEPNKEERYSQVPLLSDTRYPANGTKGKWRYASSKARLKCATYRRSTDLSVMGVRMGVANFFCFWSIDRYWRDQYTSVKTFCLAWKLWAPQAWAACGR